MLPRRPVLPSRIVLSLLVLAAAVAPARAQIGVLFTGAGPVNRSMGGAATAAPLDASGALFWNPATISGLPSSSMDFGLELLVPQTRLSSSLPANSLGAGTPPVPLSGSTQGDDGVFAIPTMALVYKPDDSQLSFGLGVFAVGGFGTNYPASTTNPILTPQPPVGMGLGALYANLELLELEPSVSMQITDHLSIGGGPTVTLAQLLADPLFIAAPDADGAYPPGTHSRMTWGGGFQIGAYYTLDGGWAFGLSYKSMQWMNNFQFQSFDEHGLPRRLSYTFDLPDIASLGVGYTGFDRWTLAADFRYVDYGNTYGFRQSGFGPDGAVRGLGWRSIFALALGAQYQLTDAASVRLGYSFNQNPIPDAVASFNVASSTISEQAIYCGGTYRVTQAFAVSLAYSHIFSNSTNGPLVTPLGAVPGSSVGNTVYADLLVFGATVKF